MLPGWVKATAHRRGIVQTIQDFVLDGVCGNASDVRSGHHGTVRAAPEGNLGLWLAVPASEEREEAQGPSRARRAGRTDESPGATVWTNDRGEVWGAVFDEGTREGGRCGGYGGAVDLAEGVWEPPAKVRSARLPGQGKNREVSGR